MPRHAEPIEIAIDKVLSHSHDTDGLDVLEPLKDHRHGQRALHGALRYYINSVDNLRIQVPSLDFDYRHTAISAALEQHADHPSLMLAFRSVVATLQRVLPMPERQAKDVAESLLLYIGRELEDQQRVASTSVVR